MAAPGKPLRLTDVSNITRWIGKPRAVPEYYLEPFMTPHEHWWAVHRHPTPSVRKEVWSATCVTDNSDSESAPLGSGDQNAKNTTPAKLYSASPREILVLLTLSFLKRLGGARDLVELHPLVQHRRELLVQLVWRTAFTGGNVPSLEGVVSELLKIGSINKARYPMYA